MILATGYQAKGFFWGRGEALKVKKVKYFLTGILNYIVSVECLNLFLHRGIFSFVLGRLR